VGVRAKFEVQQTKDVKWARQTEPVLEVTLGATNRKDGDNKDWSKWTPSGTLTMQITNPEAAKFFTPGKLLWLDFSEVEAATP